MWDSHLTSGPTRLSAKIDMIHIKVIKMVKPMMVSFTQLHVEILLAKKAWTSLPGIEVYWSSANAKENSTSWSMTVEITCIDRVCHCIVHRKKNCNSGELGWLINKNLSPTVVIGSSEVHFSTLATTPSPPKLKGMCKMKKYPAYILQISSTSHGTTGERTEKSYLSIQNIN
jgi:hypothetical protein